MKGHPQRCAEPLQRCQEQVFQFQPHELAATAKAPSDRAKGTGSTWKRYGENHGEKMGKHGEHIGKHAGFH
jgi:hypothetical protein